MAKGRALATSRASLAIRTGTGCCCFTNIFTATPAVASVRTTKRAGPPWSRDCWKITPETVDSGDFSAGGVEATPVVPLLGRDDPMVCFWRAFRWTGHQAIFLLN